MTRLIKFEAEWCGPCKKMAPIVMQLVDDHALELIVINIDEDRDTPLKYGVMGVPTLVLERDGVEHGRLVGAQPKRLAAKALGLV